MNRWMNKEINARTSKTVAQRNKTLDSKRRRTKIHRWIHKIKLNIDKAYEKEFHSLKIRIFINTLLKILTMYGQICRRATKSHRKWRTCKNYTATNIDRSTNTDRHADEQADGQTDTPGETQSFSIPSLESILSFTVGAGRSVVDPSHKLGHRATTDERAPRRRSRPICRDSHNVTNCVRSGVRGILFRAEILPRAHDEIPESL